MQNRIVIDFIKVMSNCYKINEIIKENLVRDNYFMLSAIKSGKSLSIINVFYIQKD